MALIEDKNFSSVFGNAADGIEWDHVLSAEEDDSLIEAVIEFDETQGENDKDPDDIRDELEGRPDDGNNDHTDNLDIDFDNNTDPTNEAFLLALEMDDIDFNETQGENDKSPKDIERELEGRKDDGCNKHTGTFDPSDKNFKFNMGSYSSVDGDLDDIDGATDRAANMGENLYKKGDLSTGNTIRESHTYGLTEAQALEELDMSAVKTGAAKAVGTVKAGAPKVAGAIKSGAQKVAQSQAMNSVKTGAAKAGSAVKAGAAKVGNGMAKVATHAYNHPVKTAAAAATGSAVANQVSKHTNNNQPKQEGAYDLNWYLNGSTLSESRDIEPNASLLSDLFEDATLDDMIGGDDFESEKLTHENDNQTGDMDDYEGDDDFEMDEDLYEGDDDFELDEAGEYQLSDEDKALYRTMRAKMKDPNDPDFAKLRSKAAELQALNDEEATTESYIGSYHAHGAVLEEADEDEDDDLIDVADADEDGMMSDEEVASLVAAGGDDDLIDSL